MIDCAIRARLSTNLRYLRWFSISIHIGFRAEGFSRFSRRGGHFRQGVKQASTAELTYRKVGTKRGGLCKISFEPLVAFPFE